MVRMRMTDAATVATPEAAGEVHSAAAAVHSTATAATVPAGAGFRRAEHCKAERSGRRDGQKSGLAKHGTLL
jgi:hypothetical protein